MGKPLVKLCNFFFFLSQLTVVFLPALTFELILTVSFNYRKDKNEIFFTV